jgi:23S rRNA (cytosine1962-C5)-methyltransferase
VSNDKLYVSGWEDYELIDAGGGKKLERWGSIITIRPEVQAYFRSGKPFSEWKKLAHWEFLEKGGQTGTWKALKQDAPREWSVRYNQLIFNLKLTKFKHVGLFPEQRINWDFISERLNSGSKFLNLFAYTGAASVVAKNVGAETFHVDSVKQLISWAKENMESSELSNIKWVHEDALKFARREVKRERNYTGIIMDPPAWGIGAKKEKWKLEDKIEELLENASTLIDKRGFLVVNTYSPQVKFEFLQSLANRHLRHHRPVVQELWMKTSTGKEMFYGNVLRVG